MSASNYNTKTPALVTSLASGSPAWINPNNIKVDDNTVSTCTITAGGTSTDLRIQNFALGNVNSVPVYPNQTVPANATIDGIELLIDRFGGGGAYLMDGGVYLLATVAGSTTMVGTDHSDTNFWPATAGIPHVYGGPTDLWGTTWSATDVNSSIFGVEIAAENTHGTSTIVASIRYMEAKVYWHLGKQAGIAKRYYMKVYNRAGTYLGHLPEASSVYSLTQDINSAGGSIKITVPLSIDTAKLQSGGSIQDESGADLQDEAGNSLLTEGSTPVVSVGTGSGLIRNGNKIIVYESSYWYVNSRVIFKGVVENWAAEIGDSDEISITAYSDGSDLGWYPLLGPTYTSTADQTQATAGSTLSVLSTTSTYTNAGQSFTVGAGITSLSAISVQLTGSATVTLNFYNKVATIPRAPLATVTQVVSGASATEVIFNFATQITVTPGAQYMFTISVANTQTITIGYNTANPYSGGSMYTMTQPAALYTAITANDLWFKTYYATGSYNASYLSLDPSTGMLANFMADYSTRGGLVSCTSSSITATGLTLSYNMKSNTVLDGITAMLSLAPSGFYWYVDVADDTLYFKNASTTPDVYLTKGRHLNSISLSASIENVENLLLFTGGETSPGVNMFRKYNDSTSISLYGQRLGRKSDNRVTDTTTANAIGNAEIANNKDEKFQTTVKLSDSSIDTASLHVGQVIGFRGFGSFVDSLQMQIVSYNYTPEETELTLGILPKRSTLHTERILRELIALQTLDNPTAPS